MKTKIENHSKGYDTRIETSDWRYSASIIGLIKYFSFLKKKYGGEYCLKEDESILYASNDITEEDYLEFVEYYYEEDMHHKIVENWISHNTFNEDEVKRINERLVGTAANTVMKNIFKKEKFDGSNKDRILELISENRNIIIKETFRNKKNLYANFANTNLLLKKESQPHCRLSGYNIDEGRKSKSISYQFNTDTFIQQDEIEFDFIPFAFTNTREALFINNNFTVEQLEQTYNKLETIINNELKNDKNHANVNAKAALFSEIIESAGFIDFDVEVIVKNREKAFFETLYIRKDAVKILKSLEDKRVFCFSYKRGENDYINIQNEVVNHILNHTLLDDLIEMGLKGRESKRSDRGHISSYVIKHFIEVNIKIKGGSKMTKDMKVAYACAKKVVGKFLERKQENKINTYRQKLINAVVFHDYDRACDILLQLSDYSEVSFGFAYPLFENFEEHKEIAYTFINALEKNKTDENGGISK